MIIAPACSGVPQHRWQKTCSVYHNFVVEMNRATTGHPIPNKSLNGQRLVADFQDAVPRADGK